MTNLNDILTHLADISAILTAITALFAYVSYRLGRIRRTAKLQAYFRRETRRVVRAIKDSGKSLPDNAYIEASVADLVAHVWLSPEQVLEGIFRSRNLVTRIDPDGTDIWSRIRVRYMTKAELKRSYVK